MNLINQILLQANIPESKPIPIPGLAGKFNQIVGWATWAALGVLVIALIGVAIELVQSHRNGSGFSGVSGIFKVLIAVVIVSGASTIIGALAG